MRDFVWKQKLTWLQDHVLKKMNALLLLHLPQHWLSTMTVNRNS